MTPGYWRSCRPGSAALENLAIGEAIEARERPKALERMHAELKRGDDLPAKNICLAGPTRTNSPWSRQSSQHHPQARIRKSPTSLPRL
jgi:hypothetical protein